jgi:hypothetical protein
VLNALNGQTHFADIGPATAVAAPKNDDFHASIVRGIETVLITGTAISHTRASIRQNLRVPAAKAIRAMVYRGVAGLKKEFDDMSDDREAAPVLAQSPGQTDDQLGELIERWWMDHFPGSAVARDTAAWNAAHAAKEALKRLLVHLQHLPQATARVEDNDLQGSI